MAPPIVLQTADGRRRVLERSPRSFSLPGVISALMRDELTIAVFTYLLFPICRRRGKTQIQNSAFAWSLHV